MSTITIPFTDFYDILFDMQGVQHEQRTLRRDLAELLGVFNHRIHIDYDAPDDVYTAWRIEAWKVNAARIEALRKQSEIDRQKRFTRDEAIEVIIEHLKEFLGGVLKQEEIRAIAAGIIFKKDAARAAKFGIDVSDEKWKSLWDK